jgi:hypothetical protein
MHLSSSNTPSVFVAWQDLASREWHTVARLSQVEDHFELGFTRGADRVGDIARRLFNSPLEQNYYSDQLTALFRNKIPPRSRSDFRKMAHWLNLTGDESDFELLGKFGLIPGTDGLLVYPSPKVESGRYSVEFFVHGIRHTHGEAEAHHLHGDVLKWCSEIEPGDRLCPLLDVQNPADANAVALRAENGTILIGYVPRFYAADIRAIVGRPAFARTATITVLKNNHDAPLQMRLLCRFSASVPEDFRALDDSDHQMKVEVAALL